MFQEAETSGSCACICPDKADSPSMVRLQLRALRGLHVALLDSTFRTRSCYLEQQHWLSSYDLKTCQVLDRDYVSISITPLMLL